MQPVTADQLLLLDQGPGVVVVPSLDAPYLSSHLFLFLFLVLRLVLPLFLLPLWFLSLAKQYEPKL